MTAYAELSRQVQAAGLMRRRLGWYWSRITGTVLAFTVAWVAFVLLGDSWAQMAVAAILAVAVAQFGFLGHDAAHRQIFASARWNEWSARIMSGVFAGLSYGWWTHKHNRHHGAPNQEGKDPDIASGVLAFTPAHRAGTDRARPGGSSAGRAGSSSRCSCSRASTCTSPGCARWPAGATSSIAASRPGSSSPGWAATSRSCSSCCRRAGRVAFLAVQLGLFGVLLGGAFAPNHKGMPIVPRTAKVDFLRRQVLMSRNIRGGRFTDFAMGGLNYQIEHHLFPSMPQAEPAPRAAAWSARSAPSTASRTRRRACSAPTRSSSATSTPSGCGTETRSPAPLSNNSGPEAKGHRGRLPIRCLHDDSW